MHHKTVLSPFVAGTQQPLVYHNNQSGPLAGLRLAVKDLFDIAGIATSAGNPDWLASHPVPEQTNSTVSALLDAGAQYVGKTLTDELAYSLNGQNIHYGTPQNPVTPERLPGGSSSGSAVAVAAGLADIGLGTDTGGSIRVPASYNGLYGLRPTHGVVSCDNMVGLAPDFDTVGWMTRSLETMQAVARVLIPEQPTTRKGKLGYVSAIIDAHPYKAEISTQLKLWQMKLGEPLCSVDPLPATLDAGESFRRLQGAQIQAQHGDWIAQQNPVFAPDIQARLDACKAITHSEVTHAEIARQQWCDIILPLLEEYDGLILPTTPGLAPLLTTAPEALTDYRKNLLTYTALAGLAGLPQLHIPCLTDQQAPFGLSLIGARNSEHRLLSLAAQLMEQ